MNYFCSPLEQFEVVNLLSVSSPLLNLNFSFTNLGLFTIIATALLVLLHAQGINNLTLVQSRISLFVETIYSTVHQIVKGQIGERNEIYLPFIYALFTFILCANIIGNVTYSFTVATSAVVSIGLSFMVFLGLTMLALDRHRVHFFSFFVPAGSPLILVPVLTIIELISYFARAFSLGIRLFANIVSGHALMIILAGFLYQGFSSGILISVITLIPFTLFLAIAGLEVGVSIIQAYVFSILTCIYIKDAIDLH